MKDLGYILKILFIEKKDIVFSIICGFIAGITAVILFAASGYMISKSALTSSISTLLILAVSIKLLGMISAISRYGERYFSHRGTFTMLSNIRVSFYEKLEPLVPTIFHKYRSGDLLARIVGDVEALQNFFLRVFYPPVVLLFVFFCTIFLTALFFNRNSLGLIHRSPFNYFYRSGILCINLKESGSTGETETRRIVYQSDRISLWFS